MATALRYDENATSAELQRYGYCVFRDIFSEHEINLLRQSLKDYFHASGISRYGGKFALRGLHRNDQVARILTKDAFLEVMEKCTAPARPVLTGECDLQIDIVSRWHKDIDEASVSKDVARGPWAVYKAAVYLQDQEAGSREALKVRPGSHRCRLGEIVESKALPVRAGDVIIFDVRIDHAGMLPSTGDKVLKKTLGLMARGLRKDPEKWFSQARRRLRVLRGNAPERMAVYLTFGPPLPSTFAYAKAGWSNHGPLPGPLDKIVQARLADRQIEFAQC